MPGIGEHIGKADWKKEKHVPVIECPDKVAADQAFEVRLTIGKEIPHPNTTAHHIKWVALYFHPKDAKFSYLVGKFAFEVHGEAPEGPDTGPVWANSTVTASMKVKRPGVLHAVSYCNIHGLWESEKKLEVE